jgi:glycosyltransferase involved in cell wall biosynthesis
MTAAGPPKVVLLGMTSHMPVGGNVWLVGHYAEGFRRLGYDVYYAEAHGLNPSMLMRSPADDPGDTAAAFLARTLPRFGIGPGRWAYHALYDRPRVLGMSEGELRAAYDAAALIVNVHGGTVPLPEHTAGNKLVYLGTDPVEVEAELHAGDATATAFMAAHAAHFTWGLNYGRPDCRLPVTPPFRLIPTPPPVVCDWWGPNPLPGGEAYTTVGNWRQDHRDVVLGGETYHWSKHREFLKVLDLPGRSGRAFELALSSGSYTPDDLALLSAHGWRVRDALGFSRDPDAYRDYLRRSRGEFTVAKDQNVRLRTGWFSERSAQYLAAGRPVVTQDTGFGSFLPAGDGLFPFAGTDDALAAVGAVEADYRRHSKAAAEIAREFFDAEKVVGDMLAHLGLPARRPAAAPPPAAAGVNLAGYLRAESGMGELARGYERAAEFAGLEVARLDLSALQGNHAPGADRSDPELPFDLTLVCADAELHYAAVRAAGPALFDRGYTVGLWAWELTRFPDRWHDRFAYYDEIWAGSGFVANALAPVAPVPVVCVPPVLTPVALGYGARGRARLGLGPDEFVVLFAFDFQSHPERKNPEAAAEAFRRGLGACPDARLVVKCVNAAAHPAAAARLADAVAAAGGRLIDGYWPRPDVADLTAACDVYLSLHRSEGIGLTLAEAMAHGKSVVATGWSGNLQFMTPANSYLVEFRLTELPAAVGPYPAGATWAEPNADHAAAILAHLYRRRDECAARGEVARADIETGFSPAAVAAVIRDRLRAIATRRRLAEFRAEVRDKFRRYGELAAGVRAAAAAAVPPGATIAVVSKGDDALTAFDGRTGWHFPRDPRTGGYAGFYPPDSAAAVSHLGELRAAGATHLLVPGSMGWWLDHYPGFREHLDRTAGCVHADGACRIYRLGG